MNPALRIIASAALLSTPLLFACGKPSSDAPVDQQTAETTVKTVPFARAPSPPGARVFFITPADGDIVSNPVRIEFGIEGMAVARAGTQQPDSGHHHLLIDTGLPDLTLPVPADANHKHFGDGSTSTEISLEPGRHTLRMLLADHLHIPHDPPIASDAITITVQ